MKQTTEQTQQLHYDDVRQNSPEKNTATVRDVTTVVEDPQQLQQVPPSSRSLTRPHWQTPT